MLRVGRPVVREPAWFSTPEKPLFGFLHRPADGMVRGAVLLCPSLGAELISAHAAIRSLADGLADEGFAALRFDYLGTGDSSGELVDGDGVARLDGSVKAAVEFLRSLGIDHIAGVGLRIGGALVARAAVSNGLRAVVLLDPVDGRRFLREQAARYRITVGEPPAGEDVHSVSFTYPAELADGLRRVTLDLGTEALVDQTLVLQAPGKLVDGAARRFDLIETREVSNLLEVSSVDRVLPIEAISSVVSWLSAAMPEAESAMTDDLGRGHAIPAPGVIETFESIGDAGLFAIRTSPVSNPADRSVVLLNVAAEQHIGPGRMWVELAREWAALGIETWRVDLAGIGDSPAHEGQVRDRSYSPFHLADLATIAASIDKEEPASVIPIGLCSGAVHALEWAARVRSSNVVAINPVLSLVIDDEDIGEPPVERLVVQVPSGAMREARDNPRLAWLKANLPSAGWRFLDATGLHRSPTAGLELVVEGGSDLLVITGPDDAVAYHNRGSGALRRMRRSGRFDMRTVDSIDHSLQVQMARRSVSALLTDYVIATAGVSRKSAPASVDLNQGATVQVLP